MSDTATVVGFALGAGCLVVLFIAWWSADSQLREHADRLADLEHTADLDQPPHHSRRTLVEPPTEPLHLNTVETRLDLAGGKRRPAQIPTPRGRHRTDRDSA